MTKAKAKDHVVTLKTDARSTWIALPDPASGKRGRYTVHRISRWADKPTIVVGRELDLSTARKLVSEGALDAKTTSSGDDADHECHWRKATVMLAKCVVATLQTGGKIGMGTGMVMRVVDGKKSIERWDKDFVEALAFIGIEMVDKPTRRRGQGAKAA